MDPDDAHRQLINDLRMGQQVERTALAWNRTLTALAGVIGLIGLHAYLNHGDAALSVVCAIAGVLTLLLSAQVTYGRHRRAHRQLRQRKSTRLRTEVAFLSCICVVIAVLAVITVLPG